MKELDKLKIFLSGGIDRVEDDGIGWRVEVKQRCEEAGLPFIFLDPTNKPEGLGCEVGIEKYKIKEYLRKDDWDSASEWSRDVRHIDLRMIDRTELFIIYIDLDAHLCGSYNELFEAERQQKPLFAIIKPPYKRYDFPAWLVSIFRKEEVFEGVETCVEYLEKINRGEVKLDERWLRIPL